MARQELVTLANMCMVYDDAGRVLVEDRVDPDWSGLAFPGGHVERGESMTDAVIREVYEETGLTIRHPRLCGTKDWMQPDGSRYLVLLYKANEFEGTIHDSEEGEIRWMQLEELRKSLMANTMPELLRVFLEDDVSEFHFYETGEEWNFWVK